MMLEAGLCGSGASGRNGGLALGWWFKLPTLIKLCGEEEGLRLARAAGDAVTEIGTFCREHDVEAYFKQAGRFQVATTPLHLGAWESSVQAAEKYGVDVFERLSPEDVARRGGTPVYVGGVYENGSATVQPALLARGLRRVALAKGIKIFEMSEVRSIDRGAPPVVRTERAA